MDVRFRTSAFMSLKQWSHQEHPLQTRSIVLDRTGMDGVAIGQHLGWFAVSGAIDYE